jgi:hypothetical protein
VSPGAPQFDLLYDGLMGHSSAISHESESDRWVVSVKIDLSRAETNELFLAGDTMLSWPVEGVLPASGDESMPERSGMFVSEVAAHPGGLLIWYLDQAHAERSIALLRMQLAQAGIKEEV